VRVCEEGLRDGARDSMAHRNCESSHLSNKKRLEIHLRKEDWDRGNLREAVRG
jgi:hypothetical protein